MSRDIWSPTQYRAYAAERARPVFELLARVHAADPRLVVDLGCGPGERTADLAAHWPGAVIEGIDSSEQMIIEARRTVAGSSLMSAAGFLAGRVAAGTEAAGPAAGDAATPAEPVGSSAGSGAVRAEAVGSSAGSGTACAEAAGSSAGRDGVRTEAAGAPAAGAAGRADVESLPRGTVRFSVGDLAEWVPERPVDVIFSNAAFQWVPGHERYLERWVEALAPGGWLAFGMPGNFEAPSHVILRELCRSPRWRDRLGRTVRHNIVLEPADYLRRLGELGCEVDAWETTYLQLLPGDDPILEWIKGTALRPVLDALPDPEEFLAELAPLLREAYPMGPLGTVFPFRRIFVVARKTARAGISEVQS